MKFSLSVRNISRYLAAISMLALTGCMTDNLDDCPPTSGGVTVSFRYDYNVEQVDLFSTVVKNVDLYVFNAEQSIHDVRSYSAAEVRGTDDKCYLDLKPGSYKFVAWMNLTEDYEVAGHEHLYTARLSRKTSDGITINANPEAIYHAWAEAEISGGEQEIEMAFVKDMKVVTVEMIFDAPLPQEVAIESYITGSHGIYDFQNIQVGRSTPIIYTPRYITTYAGFTMICEYSLERLMETDRLDLTIIQRQYDIEKTLETMDLVPVIMQNPKYNDQEKLDRNETFPITIYLKYVDSVFIVSEVYMEDWKYIDSDTGLH